MAEEDDKIREEILRKAQEEQERHANEEEERRLSDEARRQFEETKRVLEEHVRTTQQAFEDMGKARDDMGKRVSELERKRFEEEWERSFNEWKNKATSALREVMQHSMSRSLDSATVGQLAPGLGEMGRSMGVLLGGAIGSVFGPVGAAIGKAIGAPIVDMISMQAEGYNMLGARVARQAYGGGRGIGQDYEKTGQDYREMVNQVVRETGALATEVGAAFDALSKVGVGFEEGGKDLSQYALSVDRVLNLRPGRTLQMETDLVTKYGESAERAKVITRDMIDAMANFQVETGRSSNAMMQAFGAGQTLSNTLEQISSAARSSGASLDALNGMAIMLVTTVAGAGTMRAGDVADSGGRILSGMMPKSQGSPAAEAKRSGIDRLIMSGSNIGMQLMKRVESEGDAFHLDEGQKKRMFDSLASIHLAKQGEGRGEAYRYLAAMLQGTRNLTGNNLEAANKLFEDRGLKTIDMLNMRKMTDEMQTEGVFSAKDPAKQMEQFFKRKEKDPEYAETVARLRKFMDEAKRQGDAQASTLDKISDHMTKMSVWFNRSYWTQGRDAIAEALGLQPKASMTSILGKVGGVLSGDPQAISDVAVASSKYFGFGGGGGGGGGGVGGAPPSASGLSRQELHVSGDTHNQLQSDATASRSGLETTGQ